MLWLITEIAWFGLPATIFMIDSNARRRKIDVDPEKPDLSDKSVWPWMIVMLFAGSLTLPIYFWSTRKRASAALVGVALSVACIVAASVVRAVAGSFLGGGDPYYSG
jgi:hypothetical protein